MTIRWYLGLIALLCVPALSQSPSRRADQRASGPSRKSKVMEIDDTANGRDVHLQVGDELKLSLRENRSTGYVWELIHDGGSTLRILGDTYDAGAASRPGSPGARHWIFKAQQAGEASVELQWKRSWENLPPKEVFKCKVLIDKPRA